ncbi:MAG: hypothetical protein M3Y86_11550 [Verrucomicrobiota bacterium]|nr:hypothetical protein [Verrucomicrobiota bacterium]
MRLTKGGWMWAIGLVMSASLGMAAPPPAHVSANVRTIGTIADFPRESLRRGISGQLYKSLAISPIAAWVTARAPVTNASTGHAMIVRSDANGAFDKMALELANHYTVSGMNTIESRMALDAIMVHLLVYKIADGWMAISFASMDDSRYAGYLQHGGAWVGVSKNGQWTTISHDTSTPSDHIHRGFY